MQIYYKEEKIENYNKHSKHSGKAKILKDKSKIMRYIPVPNDGIKTPVYPDTAMPKQLVRDINLTTKTNH